MNIEPKLGPLACCGKLKPARVSVWATPFSDRAILSICRSALRVRCSDAESGS